MIIKNMLLAYYETQCLFIITELNIAEHLQTGSKSVSELALLTHCNEDKLYRVLRFISAKGLFDELPNKVFALNNESECLLARTPGNLKDLIRFHGRYFYPCAAELLNGVKNDTVSFKLKFGDLLWDYLQDHPEAGEIFHSAMKNSSENSGKKIAEIYDFSPYKMIVDVGGGLGSLLANILLKNKNSKGINFDVPNLQPTAQQYFIEKELSSRVQCLSGDFFHELPKGGDLYILKAILHGKNDELSSRVLLRCREVVPQYGKLLIIERVIRDGESYLDGCINDINMLNVTGGKDRTQEEFASILKQSGFSLLNIYPVEGSLAIIEAIPT